MLGPGDDGVEDDGGSVDGGEFDAPMDVKQPFGPLVALSW